MKKNIKECPCCGQDRPAPTEPGIWEYNELPFMKEERMWQRCEVKLPLPNDRDGQDGLRLWVDGEMIWWPSNASWRKVG